MRKTYSNNAKWQDKDLVSKGWFVVHNWILVIKSKIFFGTTVLNSAKIWESFQNIHYFESSSLSHIINKWFWYSFLTISVQLLIIKNSDKYLSKKSNLKCCLLTTSNNPLFICLIKGVLQHRKDVEINSLDVIGFCCCCFCK